MSRLLESDVEKAALSWLQAAGFAVLHGKDIAAGAPAGERADPNYGDVILVARFNQFERI